MILDMLISLIVLVLKGIVALLPSLSNITLPTGFITWFMNIVNASAYFLPLADFFSMMAIWLVVVNFQIIWKTIQRIWDALPFT